MAKYPLKTATLLLSGVDGSELELTLTGFRWSAKRGIRDDADYLRTHVRALSPFGSIEVHFSGILNWEAEDLADWLLSIAQRLPVKDSIYIREGYLDFVLRSQTDKYATIRAHVNDYVGGWHFTSNVDTEDLQDEDDWPYIDLEISHNQLTAAAVSFQQSLHRLPTRTY